MEGTLALDPSYACVLMVESQNGSIWWFFYCHLPTRDFLLTIDFRSQYADMKHERMELGPSKDEDFDPNPSGFV